MQPAEEGWAAVHGAIAPSLLRRRLGDGWRWLAANFIAERERWALWLPVFVGVGVGIYFWLTFEPPLWRRGLQRPCSKHGGWRRRSLGTSSPPSWSRGASPPSIRSPKGRASC